MTRWQVFYEAWQFECCGEPFAVGDMVRWPLVLEVGAEGPDTVEGRVEEGVVARSEDDEGQDAGGAGDFEGPEGDAGPQDFEGDAGPEEEDPEEEDDEDAGLPLDLVTPHGSVSLVLPEEGPHPEPGPGTVRLRGRLLVGGHGSGGDPLPLRVHRLWVRCEPEVPDGEGRVPDPARPPYLREVTAPPRSFAFAERLFAPPENAEATGGTVFLRATGYLPGVCETGVLAEVEPVLPPAP
ncbi:DUF6578 domain-containing protein [Streptomyces sp. NPDC088925]|uniref:DUF6578 domain-containing protein n=1 Tax=Streptomyces sp. NPDC088925 TaxID=3365914 RepID=UPI00381A676F